MDPERNRDENSPPSSGDSGGTDPEVLVGQSESVQFPAECIPLPYQVLDGNGTIQTVNQAWTELVGYEPEEVEGEQFSSFLTPESREQFESMPAVCDSPESDASFQFELRCADDSLAVVSFERRIESRPQPEPDRIHCQFYDITEHRLRKSRLRRLEKAVEASGHAVYLTDTDGTIEYVNPAFDEITGYSTEEALGATPRLFKSGEMSETYYNDLWETIKSGGVWEEEITNRKKDGTLYDAHQTIAPVTDDEGEIQTFVAVQTDITEPKRRQRELARSRERLRILFEESPDSIVIHDADGEVIDVNKELVESLGYSRDELLSMNVADFEVGIDLDDLAVFWEEASFDENHAIEGVHRRQDGSEFPVEVWISKIEFEGETQFIAQCRDISDRKERERELERKEFLFERVQEIADIGIWEYQPETGDVWWSEGIREIYDVDDGFEPTMKSAIEFYHPEDRETIREAIEKALETGEWYDHDIRLLRDDGTQRYARARGELTRTEDGQKLLRGVFQDVTHQKQRERELERYERLVENVPLGVYRNTPGEDGEFNLINDGMVEMFDAESKAHLREHSVSALYADPDGRERFSNKLAAESVVKNEELELITLSGERLWASVSAVAREVGDTLVFDGVIQDISERKAYQQQLKDQRDNLDILNQVLRHDIRNDLQLVLSYAELLEEHVDEEGNSYLSTVQESANNAVELTQTARDLAEVMLQPELENTTVRMFPIVEQVQETIRSSYPDAVLQIDDSLGGIEVIGNEMLDSVFRNLFKNAIQHNDKKVPKVVLSSELNESDSVVTLYIADNGPGIPDNQKSEIFGKGEKRLDSEGTGIGLYLVQSLIDSYQGDVWVEDRHDKTFTPNQLLDEDHSEGAVFVVELPLASEVK